MDAVEGREEGGRKRKRRKEGKKEGKKRKEETMKDHLQKLLYASSMSLFALERAKQISSS